MIKVTFLLHLRIFIFPKFLLFFQYFIVLADSVKAGADIGAIFKEPTITPSAVQVKEMGLKKAWGSPNGAMRRGWNGITISRDTIHIVRLNMADIRLLTETYVIFLYRFIYFYIRRKG
jgi:hypothetical protein